MNFERPDFILKGYDVIHYSIRIDYILDPDSDEGFAGISGFDNEEKAKDFLEAILGGDYVPGTEVEFTKSYVLNTTVVKEEMISYHKFILQNGESVPLQYPERLPYM